MSARTLSVDLHFLQRMFVFSPKLPLQKTPKNQRKDFLDCVAFEISCPQHN